MLAVALMASITAMAGDGTKANPYTVSELKAQCDALRSNGATVWVKADLKGLGEDGTLTENADTEDGNGKTVRRMAALFGDETGKNVFRIGGDEFAAICLGFTEEEAKQALARFREEQKHYGISISAGYAWAPDMRGA